MDINYFLEKYKGDYEEVKLELDLSRANAGLSGIIIPDFSGVDEKTREIYLSLGFSEEEIIVFKHQLHELACSLPLHSKGLSFNDICDYIENRTSELDNKRIYMHLIECYYCRDRLFEQAWSMLEP